MENLILKDGDFCNVIAGTHKGKSGYVQDIHTSKTGHVTITVLQENGVTKGDLRAIISTSTQSFFIKLYHYTSGSDITNHYALF